MLGEGRGGGRWVIFLFACVYLLPGQQPGTQALDKATVAYQQRQLDRAGQILIGFLRDHPTDENALSLMGAVLDAGQQFQAAGAYYARALKAAPRSAQVLNNAANHYLACGDRARARELYLKTLAIDPRHSNANLQLAQMSLDDKRAAQALSYLDRAGPAETSDPGVRLLRARVLALAGRCMEADVLLDEFENVPEAGASLFFSVGLAQAECKHYQKAAATFSRALNQDPRNPDILYNLGLAALRSGDLPRARDALESVLHGKPEDADSLYALAQVSLQDQAPLTAASLLVRAEKAAPRNPDIVLLYARVAAQLEFFEDSAAAYDRYLELKPNDEIARRERGFLHALANQSANALQDLTWYIGKHPRDATGYYELGVAQALEDRAGALRSLDTAVQLDPALSEARYTRALLSIEEGNLEKAAEDLRIFVEKHPDNPQAWAHLGQCYLAMEKPEDAVKVLERANALAPDSTLVLVQYRRALVRLDRNAEAAAVLSHLRAAAGGKSNISRVGLSDYLNLSPAGQQAKYVAYLRQSSAADPENILLKIRLARELLASGQNSEALDLLNHVSLQAMNMTQIVQCGRMLLEFEQFAGAVRFLKPAVQKSAPGAGLDLAVALYHVRNAGEALSELDKVPAGERQGDFYLLRAQLLDALGEYSAAADELNRGIRSSPTRPELYLQAAAFLLKHKLNERALDLLKKAAQVLPDNRELLLAQAVTLAIMPRDDDAQAVLAKIQAHWPEWDRPYLLNGIILEIQLRSAEARSLLDTAIALGAETPEAYYYQALAITHAAPAEMEQAQKAIDRAIELTSTDPYVYLLAGKISMARRQYGPAVQYLCRAVTLLPNLIPAHYALRDAYQALGDHDKSAAELAAIEKISDANAASDHSPFPMEDFIFTVRAPG